MATAKKITEGNKVIQCQWLFNLKVVELDVVALNILLLK
jgi:hypothetical protein